MKKILLKFIIIVLFLSILSCNNPFEEIDLSVYQYRDTRNLVKFVYNAFILFQEKDTLAIDYFVENRDLFKKGDFYVYIYDMDGKCWFNAGVPEFEGNTILDYTDKHGRKVIQQILEAIDDKENPHGWVHFTWFEHGMIYPVFKSSCNFKAVASDNKAYIIGGGMTNPHEEREFARICVDSAINLIMNRGKNALNYIKDPVSRYNYRDTSVFVFTADGRMLISPIVDEHLIDINILEARDATDHMPFIKAIESLKTKDRTWEIFMIKCRYSRTLIKKTIYLRKTSIDDMEVFAGAVTDLPSPP